MAVWPSTGGRTRTTRRASETAAPAAVSLYDRLPMAIGIALRLLSVLVAVLLLPTLSLAQDPRLEAAKKEGKVVWYTSLALPSAEKVAKLFEVAYPGIKVE